jgi:hypothetical protein
MTTTDTTVLPDVSPETLSEARRAVANLLSSSDSFKSLEPGRREQIAGDTARIAAALAEPPLSPTAPRRREDGKQDFTAQAAREGAEVAGLLLEQVNFPDFVAGLVKGVFHAIVQSSIEQMEAYGRLVADVSKSLNQFRDENVPASQGRDHLVEQFPDTFMMDLQADDDGNPTARVKLREGVDEDAAVKQVSSLPVAGGPVSDLSDETIEERLVPAARTQLATSRQQLLATLVVMGVNRIVVTDGRISAKVMYDFRATDNFHKQLARTDLKYGDQYKYSGTGESEQKYDGGESQWDKDGGSSRGGSYYAKGKYSYQAEPVLKLASVTTETTDATLSTKASLAGMVDINFKSDYLPLEKMADSFQISQIQNAAQPTSTAPAAGSAAPATPPPVAAAP